MDFFFRCNGIWTGHRPYTQDAVNVFSSLVDPAREEFKKYVKENFVKSFRDYAFGTRYHDNRTVLERITSVTSQDEFMSDPINWILDALRDCAEADYYYFVEKSW